MAPVSQQPLNVAETATPDLSPRALWHADQIANVSARRAIEGLPPFRSVDPWFDFVAGIGYREGQLSRGGGSK